jgi:hypothetical protein
MERLELGGVHPMQTNVCPEQQEISLKEHIARENQGENGRSEEISSRNKREDYKLNKSDVNPYDLDLEVNPSMLSGPGPHIGLSYSCYGSCCHASCTCSGSCTCTCMTCTCTCAGCW